jgi:hypothetical protein
LACLGGNPGEKQTRASRSVSLLLMSKPKTGARSVSQISGDGSSAEMASALLD